LDRGLHERAPAERVRHDDALKLRDAAHRLAADDREPVVAVEQGELADHDARDGGGVRAQPPEVDGGVLERALEAKWGGPLWQFMMDLEGVAK